MRSVTVSNKFQKKYTYVCTKPVGKHFDPAFKPQLSPQEMLELGVFGGAYWVGSGQEIPKEFPAIWFKKAKLTHDGKPHKELNYFGVIASQSLQEWQKKGWIHKDDPHGWFEWYCRYYTGRRHEDDARQIKRWGMMARHIAQIQYNCMKGDETCRRRQRQALLHWAYDSRTF
jgi:hypothetical protein